MLFLVVIALCGALASGATISDPSDFELPEGFKTCYEDDPNLNECIKGIIQDIITNYYDGNEQLGLIPTDPFTIDSDQFDYNAGGIQASLIVKGVNVLGDKRVEIKDVDTKITETGLTSEIKAFAPRIFTEGRYKANVKINDLKMKPKGYFNATFTNIKSVSKLAGDFEYNNGVKYLRLTSFDFSPEVEDMKFFASGLVPDQQFNDIVLGFANQYIPGMYKLLFVMAKEHWEPRVLKHLNEFFLTVPFEAIIKKRTL